MKQNSHKKSSRLKIDYRFANRIIIERNIQIGQTAILFRTVIYQAHLVWLPNAIDQ